MEKKFLTDKEIYDLFIQKANIKLKRENISYINEDDLHSKAHALFHQIVNEIADTIVIDFELYWDGEEWYDNFYDDVMEYILMAIH